jgi:hypothetical protein
MVLTKNCDEAEWIFTQRSSGMLANAQGKRREIAKFKELRMLVSGINKAFNKMKHLQSYEGQTP